MKKTSEESKGTTAWTDLLWDSPQPPEAPEPFNPSYYIVEVTACTALKPQAAAGAPPMQALRDNAVHRTLEMKKVLKGLVDLKRVE